MRLTAKDRFQELKELIRREKIKEFQVGDNGEDMFSAMPITAITTNDTGKKRPGFETLMSRPRHFSQGHYMNVKPTIKSIDDNMATTVSQQVIIVEFINVLYIFY